MSKYDKIPGVFFDTNTLTLMCQLFPAGVKDAAFGAVTRAVFETIVNNGTGIEFSDVTEKVMFDYLLEAALKKAEDWRNKFPNSRNNETEPIEVSTTEPEPVYTHRNIVCSKEDGNELKRLLSLKSDILNQSDRKILMALVKTNHSFTKKTPDEPIIYSNRKCEEVLNCHEGERNHLMKVLGERGILEKGHKKIGTFENGEDMYVTVYWLDEPALLKLLRHEDFDEFAESMVSLNDETDTPTVEVQQESGVPVELDAELVYSSKDGPVSTEKKEFLPHNEATMLYYLNEASQKRENKLRLGSTKFICTVAYLKKFIDGGSIKKTRDSLIEKGYIEVSSTPHYKGYLYRIIRFPDYLKNKKVA